MCVRQDRVERTLNGLEELTECWQVTGDIDYLARFVCPDITRYEALSSALIDDAELGVARIVSHIALRPVHRFTGLPVELLLDPTRS